MIQKSEFKFVVVKDVKSPAKILFAIFACNININH